MIRAPRGFRGRTILVGVTLVASLSVVVPGGIPQGSAGDVDDERERAFVEALRREDPSGAELYVALRDARGQAVAELQRVQARYSAAGSELRPIILRQLQDAHATRKRSAGSAGSLRSTLGCARNSRSSSGKNDGRLASRSSEGG